MDQDNTALCASWQVSTMLIPDCDRNLTEANLGPTRLWECSRTTERWCTKPVEVSLEITGIEVSTPPDAPDKIKLYSIP
jgi:hypothetical protein